MFSSSRIPRFVRPAAAALALATAVLAVTTAGLEAQAQQKRIYASVADKKGVPIAPVAVGDIVVREDGVAREILSVAPATEPMRVALLVDNSQAATRSIQYLRDGLSAFAKRLTSAGHTVALVTLADRPTLEVDATSDLARLKSRGIDRLFAQPGSGMYLLEGISDVSKGFLKNETPRPVMVAVVTEGQEFSNLSSDAVVRAIRDCGAQFHALILTDGDAAPLNEDETRQRNIVLDRGPRETGGRRENIISSQSVGRELDELATELLGQVVVTYASPQRLIPAEKITIAASREGIDVRGVPVRTPAAPLQER